MSLCFYFLIHPLQPLSWAPIFKRRIRYPCIISFLSSQPPGGFIIITVLSWSVFLLVSFLATDAKFKPLFMSPSLEITGPLLWERENLLLHTFLSLPSDFNLLCHYFYFVKILGLPGKIQDTQLSFKFGYIMKKLLV